MKTILDKLEQNANSDKIIFSDIDNSITYRDFVTKCKAVASSLLNHFKQAVAIFDNRDVNTLIAMIGTLYSGNHYVVIDSASPVERINKIFEVVKPAVSIIQEKNAGLIEGLSVKTDEVHDINRISGGECKSEEILLRQKDIISTDPAYILFTSGSTGTPKGTVVSHLNIITYIDWFVNEFKIDGNTVFGNQTSFYFSMSVSDIFSTIYSGATLNIIPRSYFTFLPQCVEFLNERKVNTIYWVPSALCLFANIKMLDYAKPLFLKQVMFAGEPMPNKQLNYWRKKLDATYINLFGPTETTDICTFYVVNREFKDDEALPIGVHCNNCDTFIIDDDGNEVTEQNTIGQLYVRGAFLALGYFDNPEKTADAFVQNPLNKNYPELVYKTGDLVKINKYGEYEYVGRVDSQIKHMGYRIELGEIETAVYGIDKIKSAVAVFDAVKDAIVLIYVGKMKEDELLSALTNKIPNYMLPSILIKVSELPYNANGKMDRAWLNKNYATYIKVR